MENQETVTQEQMDEMFQDMDKILETILQNPRLWAIPEVKTALIDITDYLEKVIAEAKQGEEA